MHAKNSWMLGVGTTIDYKKKKKKQIIVNELSPHSCSDYGTLISRTYTYNPKTHRFAQQVKKKHYDGGE